MKHNQHVVNHLVDMYDCKDDVNYSRGVNFERPRFRRRADKLFYYIQSHSITKG